MEGIQRNSTISWIVNVPCSDANWVNATERATLEELEFALNTIESNGTRNNKTKISKLNSIIKRRKK